MDRANRMWTNLHVRIALLGESCRRPRGAFTEVKRNRRSRSSRTNELLFRDNVAASTIDEEWKRRDSNRGKTRRDTRRMRKRHGWLIRLSRSDRKIIVFVPNRDARLWRIYLLFIMSPSFVHHNPICCESAKFDLIFLNMFSKDIYTYDNTRELGLVCWYCNNSQIWMRMLMKAHIRTNSKTLSINDYAAYFTYTKIILILFLFSTFSCERNFTKQRFY